MDRLAAMRTFLRVADTGSFSEAARQLGLPKSLATRRVSQLELSLGVPLLVRSNRAVRLSEHGALYAPRLRELLDELDALDASLGASATQMRGSPSAFGVRWLAPLLSEFLCAHPHLVAELELIDRPVDPVDEGFDLVLTDSASVSGQYEEQPLMRFHTALVAAPAYLARAGAPASPADLKRLDIIHYVCADSGQAWRFIDDSGAEQRVIVNPRFSTSSGVIMRDVALAAQGIALLPEFLVEDDLRTQRLERILPAWHSPALLLKAVFPRRRETLTKTRLLVDFLRARLPHG